MKMMIQISTTGVFLRTNKVRKLFGHDQGGKKKELERWNHLDTYMIPQRRKQQPQLDHKQKQQAKPANIVAYPTMKKHAQWKFIPGTSSTSWKDVCKLGRNLDEDCQLQYVPPSANESELYASIARSEILANVNIGTIP